MDEKKSAAGDAAYSFLKSKKPGEKQYISLARAAELCAYSEAYLRLRARQKKLKAVKSQKKWMTTVEWLREYENSAKDWASQVQGRMAENVSAPAPAQKKPAAKEKNKIAFSAVCMGIAVFAVMAGVSSLMFKTIVDGWPELYAFILRAASGFAAAIAGFFHNLP